MTPVGEKVNCFLLASVESLVAWHQGRLVNARKKQNSQNRPKHDAKGAGKNSKKNVVEEKEVRHDGEQSSEKKKSQNDQVQSLPISCLKYQK